MSQSGTVQQYTVHGMTCQHCVASVKEEVSELPGVAAVTVDLATGRLVVAGEVAEDAVRTAVTEAGYEVAASIRRHP